MGGYAAAAMGGAPAEQLATCKPPNVDDVCFMTVYMDGALYYSNAMPGPPLDLSRINILNFQALEVYRSPAEMPGRVQRHRLVLRGHPALDQMSGPGMAWPLRLQPVARRPSLPVAA